MSRQYTEYSVGFFESTSTGWVTLWTKTSRDRFDAEKALPRVQADQDGREFPLSAGRPIRVLRRTVTVGDWEKADS